MNTNAVTVAPFGSPERTAIMERLGLRPVFVRDVTSISSWSFTTFRRDLADPPAIATRGMTWYVGEHEGVAIVVRPTVLSPTAYFNTVVAEIDPPLFAGLRLYPRELIPFFGALPDPYIGNPTFDRSFVVQSYDAKRTYALFGANERLVEPIMEQRAKYSIVVRDRFIEVFDSGFSAFESRLRDQIEVGANLARIMSARSSDLPERSEENAARESWSRYAFHIPLSFDRRRWRIWGQLHGLDVEAYLGGTPPSVITTLRVTFAYPLNCGLYMRHGIYVSKGLFSRTKKPGYKELDSMLLIDAQDEAKRKTLLADKDLRSMIANEATKAGLVITDRAITTTHATFLSGEVISERLEALVAIAHRLAPPHKSAGPFR